MSKRLYVAYGSNLNVSQMAYRCPTAKLYGTGVIEDYALQFKGSPESAFATIAPKNGSSVPVAVWEIQPGDEKSLDRYEGYPSHYFKKNVAVQLDNGQEVNAMVYIMNLKMNFGMPSTHYYRTVHQGYMDCGLDTDVLAEALKDSTQKFYTSAVRFPSYQIRMNFPNNTSHDEYESEEEDYDEDYDEEEEMCCDDEEEELDESDPFYSSDGMQWRGM